MDLDTFEASLADEQPPAGLSPALQALWYDAKDDWDRAHDLVQPDANRSQSWIHAYLHRKEGDIGNARYWYHRAGVPPAEGPLPAEWRAIVEALLAEDDPAFEHHPDGEDR